MGSTVAVGHMEITSNHESAEEMAKVLAPVKENGKEPRVIKDRGEAPAEPENPLSKAAAELGKAGGKAAAEARAKAEPAPKVEAKPEPTPKEPAVEPEHDDKGEGKDSRKGDPRFDPRARVMEATREAKEQRERAERLEAELREIKAKAAPPEPKPAPKAETAPTKPRVEDYETYEEYVEALTDWKAEDRDRKRAESAKRESQHKALEEQHRTFFGRMQEAFTANPDSREKVAALMADMTPTSLLALRGEPATAKSDLAQAIVESEAGPALLQHFADHPDEYEAALRLPDSYSVARLVGRLEARFEKGKAEPEPAPKPKSQAPPPLKPVAAGSVSAEPDITGDIDFKTFMQRKKQAR